MEKFSVKDFYKSEIDQIWDEAKIENKELLSRGYAVHDEIIKNTILFIGINPSFSGKNKKRGSYFFNNNDDDEKMHKYFNKFKKISKEIDLPWTHFDLLYFRETNQKYISELLNDKNGIGFIYNQLQLSKKIITNAVPKILVVTNTMFRHFMGLDKDKQKNTGVWMDFDFEFDDNLGTYKIIDSELDGVPVFFISMLTGQRALDNGSFKRLVWHINFVLKKIN